MPNPAGDALTPEEITTALKEIAASSKKVWATVQCKHCWKEGKYEVEVSDDKTRLQAIQFMHENGYGKPSTKQDDGPKVDLDVDVTKLSMEERTQLRAALIAKQGIPLLDAVATHTGKATLPTVSPPIS